MYILLLPLYFVFLGSSVGLINIAPLFQLSSPIGDFNAKDVILIILLVTSIPYYVRQRNVLRHLRWFRGIEFLWVIFIMFLAFQGYRSPANNLPARLNNVRFVQDFLIFFPTIALISTVKRYKTLEAIGRIFAIIGTFLVIIQSIRGYEPLFDSSYYDIGPWLGGIQIVGNLTRVYLAITDWIAFICIVVIVHLLIRVNVWDILVTSFLLVAVMISFARSMWVGIVTGLVLIIYMLNSFKILRGTRILKIASIPLLIGVGISLSLVLGVEGLIEALLFRIREGYVILTESSGSWASRLIAQDIAINIWKQNPVWGVGTNYLPIVGRIVDLGVPLALVSVGIIGLVLIIVFFTSMFFLGWTTAREGALRRSISMVVVGASLSAEIVFAVVYQQFLSSRYFEFIAIWSAVAVTFLSIVPHSFEDTNHGTRE